MGLTEGELIEELRSYGEQRGVHQCDGRWFHVLARLPDYRYGLKTPYPAIQTVVDDDELEEMVGGWG